MALRRPSVPSTRNAPSAAPLSPHRLPAIMRSMTGGFRDYLNESSAVLCAAGDAIGQDLLDGAVESIVAALSTGKPLLVCGNGGSAADAMHITAELVGRFLEERRAWRAICLSSNPAV